MPATISVSKASAPPRTVLIRNCDSWLVPVGASRRSTTRVPVSVGSRVYDQMERFSLMERDGLVGLEADDLRRGGPHQQALAVEVEGLGAFADLAGDAHLAALGAPLAHPLQVGHDRPHVLRGGGDLDAGFEGVGHGSALRFELGGTGGHAYRTS